MLEIAQARRNDGAPDDACSSVILPGSSRLHILKVCNMGLFRFCFNVTILACFLIKVHPKLTMPRLN